MKKILLLFLLYLVTFNSWADRVEFKADAPDVVVQGDQFRLTYTVNSMNVNGFRIPAIKGFDVLMGPSQSQQSYTQVINGKMSSSQQITYTYILMANNTGTFTIGGATIEVGGETYHSNGLRIKVLPPDAQQSRSKHNGERAAERRQEITPINSNSIFMRAIPSKTTVHEQEAILLTYKLYSLVNVQQLNPNMPDITGFHVQEIPLSNTKQWTLERYNGRNYQTVVWRQFVLFPQGSGRMTIPAASFDATIQVMNQVDMDDPFDALMNGNTFDYVKKKLNTPAIAINVQPLPKKPSDFSGGVGTFTMKSAINSTNVLTNDAITLKLTINGNGNLKLMNNPKVEFPDGFDAYDPKVSNDIRTTTQGVAGTKTIEYLAVPRNVGTFTIPPVKLTYFDTESNSYRTIQSEPYEIHVKKGKGNSSQVIADFTDKESVKMLANDVRYIKTGKTNYLPVGYTFFGTPLFLMWYIIPLCIFAIVVLILRQRTIANRNISFTKQKKANKVALRRMKQAHQLLLSGKQTEFYDEILKALWGYVSDKLNMPVSSLSKDNIETELRAKAVPDEVITAFINILNNCEFARYAPGDQAKVMDNTYNASLDVITKIENMIKK